MSEFYKKQLARLQALADSYLDAITFLLTPGNEQAEYTLDTGQDRQQVKRHNLTDLQNNYDNLIAKIIEIEIALDCDSVTQGRPLC